MADNENKELVKVPATVPGKKGFQKGHTGVPGSGRKKGSTEATKFVWLAREIAEAENFNLFSMMITAFRTGTLPPVGGPGAVDAATKKPLPLVTLNAEERMKCGRDLLRYLMPALSAIQVTGADGGPLRIEEVNVTELMMNPELAQAAQKLALGLSTAQRERDNEIIDAEFTDVTESDTSPTLTQSPLTEPVK